MTKPIPTVIAETYHAAITREVAYLPIEDDLCVYRVSHSTGFSEDRVPEAFLRRVTDKAEQGFATLARIQDFIGGKTTILEPEQGLCLAPKGFKEAAQTTSFYKALELFEDRFATRPTLIKAFSEGDASLDDVLLIEHSSHMLFDRKGNVLPTAIHYDYIKAGMDESRYDLDVALEILRKDPRVTPIDPDERPHRPSTLTKESWTVSNIPGYNREVGRSKYLTFWYSPTQEDMTALWEKCLSYGREYPSTKKHQAVFDLDLLGLRAGGASKHDDFYKSDSY